MNCLFVPIAIVVVVVVHVSLSLFSFSRYPKRETKRNEWDSVMCRQLERKCTLKKQIIQCTIYSWYRSRVLLGRVSTGTKRKYVDRIWCMCSLLVLLTFALMRLSDSFIYDFFFFPITYKLFVLNHKKQFTELDFSAQEMVVIDNNWLL